MRKIKFRAKRKDNGEYIYGYYIEDKGLIKGSQIIPFYYNEDYGEIESHPIIPETLQQYIGMVDGEEIYK